MPDAASPSCSTSSCNNVSQSERSASAVLGAALLYLGARQVSLPGWLLLGIGAAMAYRASTGYCPAYDLLDINTAKPDEPAEKIAY